MLPDSYSSVAGSQTLVNVGQHSLVGGVRSFYLPIRAGYRVHADDLALRQTFAQPRQATYPGLGSRVSTCLSVGPITVSSFRFTSVRKCPGVRWLTRLAKCRGILPALHCDELLVRWAQTMALCLLRRIALPYQHCKSGIKLNKQIQKLN